MKKNKIYDNILFFGAAFIIPYVYYFTLRPNLLKIENSIENKITDVSDKEVERMKKKMESYKKENKYKSEILSED
jgi:hypothetical protein